MGNNFMIYGNNGSKLWFDVERIWETTQMTKYIFDKRLWFDVERIWETTHHQFIMMSSQLWFDVERIWETTICRLYCGYDCCGLM